MKNKQTHFFRAFVRDCARNSSDEPTASCIFIFPKVFRPLQSTLLPQNNGYETNWNRDKVSTAKTQKAPNISLTVLQLVIYLLKILGWAIQCGGQKRWFKVPLLTAVAAYLILLRKSTTLPPLPPAVSLLPRPGHYSQLSALPGDTCGIPFHLLLTETPPDPR